MNSFYQSSNFSICQTNHYYSDITNPITNIFSTHLKTNKQSFPFYHLILLNQRIPPTRYPTSQFARPTITILTFLIQLPTFSLYKSIFFTPKLNLYISSTFLALSPPLVFFNSIYLF